MPTDTLTNPHDKFFRETFSRREVAHDFVKYYLPQNVVNLLDLTTLDISKDSFIDPTLEEHFSDLLYQVTLSTGQPLYIYLLFDHKSYVDPLVSFQLLRYKVKIWELSLKQQQEQRKAQPRGHKTPLDLPPIFPLVVYHGLDKWNVSLEFQGLFKALPEPLQPYVPNYSYWLVDLSGIDDHSLKGYLILQVAILLLKYIQREELGARLPEILGLLKKLTQQHTGLEYLETILRYVSSGTDKVTKETLQEKVHALFEDEEDTIMPTIAETWVEQGRQEMRTLTEQRMTMMEQRVQELALVVQNVQNIQSISEQRLKEYEQSLRTSEQNLKETEQKMRLIILKNISQTLAIRFAVPLEQYTSRLKSLDLVALEWLNELAFSTPTLAEFEAQLLAFKKPRRSRSSQGRI